MKVAILNSDPSILRMPVWMKVPILKCDLAKVQNALLDESGHSQIWLGESVKCPVG